EDFFILKNRIPTADERRETQMPGDIQAMQASVEGSYSTTYTATFSRVVYLCSSAVRVHLFRTAGLWGATAVLSRTKRRGSGPRTVPVRRVSVGKRSVRGSAKKLRSADGIWFVLCSEPGMSQHRPAVGTGTPVPKLKVASGHACAGAATAISPATADR